MFRHILASRTYLWKLVAIGRVGGGGYKGDLYMGVWWPANESPKYRARATLLTQLS